MKYVRLYAKGCSVESPSMRREWIEISDYIKSIDYSNVSLHAEGVD